MFAASELVMTVTSTSFSASAESPSMPVFKGTKYGETMMTSLFAFDSDLKSGAVISSSSDARPLMPLSGVS